MDFETFRENLARDIKETLEARSGSDFEVEHRTAEKMKGTLAMEVVSKERNAELLDTVPHKDIEDMSVVYRFVLGETPAGSGTILVTNQMLENYGITADQRHEFGYSRTQGAFYMGQKKKTRENLESLRHYYCIIMVTTSWSKRGRYG